MKQNSNQPKHLYTPLIQKINLQWYKDCRGGSGAVQRNHYPRTMLLPKDFFSYYSFGLPIHFVSIVQKPDGFHIKKNCRKLIEKMVDDKIKLQPFELIQEDCKIQIRYRYDWHIGAIPGRYTYDKSGQKQPINELALELLPNDFGQVICNGRFRDWDTGSWYYTIDILNVIQPEKYTKSLTSFIDRKPNKIYTQLKLLR